MDKQSIRSVWAKFLEVQEGMYGKKKEGLDPVGKEDDDVDNDGDTDSSDKYLKNRRKAIGKAMKKEGSEESPYPSLDKKKREKKGSSLEDAGGPAAKLKGEAVENGEDDEEEKGKKPEKGVNPFAKKKDDDKKKEVEESNCKTRKENDEEGEDDKEECPKCKGEGCDHCDGKGYHEMEKETYGKKMKESNLFSADELAALEEKAKHVGTKGPAPSAPEEFMSTSSPKEKKVFKDHEAGSDKKLEDYEEMGEMDAVKAGKGGPGQSPVRRGDKRASEPMKSVAKK